MSLRIGSRIIWRRHCLSVCKYNSKSHRLDEYSLTVLEGDISCPWRLGRRLGYLEMICCELSRRPRLTILSVVSRGKDFKTIACSQMDIGTTLKISYYVASSNYSPKFRL